MDDAIELMGAAIPDQAEVVRSPRLVGTWRISGWEIPLSKRTGNVSPFAMQDGRAVSTRSATWPSPWMAHKATRRGSLRAAHRRSARPCAGSAGCRLTYVSASPSIACRKAARSLGIACGSENSFSANGRPSPWGHHGFAKEGSISQRCMLGAPCWRGSARDDPRLRHRQAWTPPRRLLPRFPHTTMSESMHEPCWRLRAALPLTQVNARPRKPQ